jgi:nucleotide-binding universal stress UspA family protein
MFKRILVPVDGSKPSNSGLRAATRLAREQGARLRLVHLAQQVPVKAPKSTDLTVGELYERIEAAGERLLERHARYCRSLGLKPETALYVGLGGRASEMIVDEAAKWRADLIVMGTHGRRGLGRLALGSDAEQVVRHSTVPVLLVRLAHRS